MPVASWFGRDSAPTIIVFEQKRVAQGDAIHCPKLDEKSVSLSIEKKQHEQVLKQLRVRLAHVAGAILHESSGIAPIFSDSQ
jgi:hypothetical protein